MYNSQKLNKKAETMQTKLTKDVHHSWNCHNAHKWQKLYSKAETVTVHIADKSCTATLKVCTCCLCRHISTNSKQNWVQSYCSMHRVYQSSSTSNRSTKCSKDPYSRHLRQDLQNECLKYLFFSENGTGMRQSNQKITKICIPYIKANQKNWSNTVHNCLHCCNVEKFKLT